MTLREKIDAAVSEIKLPAAARTELRNILNSGSCPSVIARADAGRIAHSAAVDEGQLMLQLAPVAKQFAVPPISHFQVGAVARGLTGNLYFGANMEFPGVALSFCVHAEQAATINAWVHGERGLDRLAVNYAPCGYCRQFLYELITARSLEVLLPHLPPTLLTTLLPHAFGPQDLNVQGGLMEPKMNHVALDETTQDPVILVALSAARMCYAPYSRGPAGVALAARSGEIFTGPYAENAAYNPSMSPMEAAMAHLNLCGAAYQDITRAVLVQTQPSPAAQVEASQIVLQTASKVKLEVASAHFEEKKRSSSSVV